MKIDLSKGHYCFQLDITDLISYISADNVIAAKEQYLKCISKQIDEAIDDAFWRLNQLEK